LNCIWLSILRAQLCVDVKNDCRSFEILDQTESYAITSFRVFEWNGGQHFKLAEKRNRPTDPGHLEPVYEKIYFGTQLFLNFFRTQCNRDPGRFDPTPSLSAMGTKIEGEREIKHLFIETNTMEK
jgi:hypothetical protein